MTERFQNLRLATLALMLFLAIVGLAYMSAYWYLGEREVFDEGVGKGFTIMCRFPSPGVAEVFKPLGRVESLLTQRDVYVHGRSRLDFLINDPPPLGY